MERIESFKGDYDFLSNFYESPVEYKQVTYQNNEAAFQAQKTMDTAKRMAFSGLSASEAKKLGRKVELRSDWEQVKEQEMFNICMEKFTQNPELKEKLLATGDAELIEGNWWHDNTWGNCSCAKCVNINGRNLLGKILMRVRDALRAEK